jgi:hypothetical protein
MYLSADDARSDFFLAAAVYVIGPTLVSLLLRALPALQRSTLLATAIAVLVPFITIAAMPLFLMRYREGSFASLRHGGAGSLAMGAALAAVFTAALALGEVLGGGQLVLLADLLPGATIAGLAIRWASLAVLAVFLYRRAEYAFRPISEPQEELVRKAGIACIGTAGVATVLLLLAGRPIWSVLAAAGLAGMYLLAERQLPQQGVGERWWVWAPVITLALGPIEIFSIFFGGSEFLASAQQAAVVALFGLVVGMGLHVRRGAVLAFGLALVMLVADLLSLGGGTGFLV